MLCPSNSTPRDIIQRTAFNWPGLIYENFSRNTGSESLEWNKFLNNIFHSLSFLELICLRKSMWYFWSLLRNLLKTFHLAKAKEWSSNTWETIPWQNFFHLDLLIYFNKVQICIYSHPQKGIRLHWTLSHSSNKLHHPQIF